MLNRTAFNSPTFGACRDGGNTGITFVNGTGQRQYIQTASNVPASMQGSPAFTAEVLVYIPSSGQPSAPLYTPFLWWGGNGTGNSAYFSLSDLNANQVFVGFYNSGLLMTGTINLNSWNLITWVRNSNGGTNNSLTGSTLYINGVAVATVSDTHLAGSGGIFPTVQAGPLTIERAGDLSRYFSGTVDEAVVFPTALSASVIAQHYADLTAPQHPAFFNGEVSLGSGVYYLQFPSGNVFGYYNYQGFPPIFYSYSLGFEAFIDGGSGAAYLYDFTSGHWWYTRPSLFPYLYDFSLNNWLFYFAGSTNPRSFGDLTTGKIITM